MPGLSGADGGGGSAAAGACFMATEKLSAEAALLAFPEANKPCGGRPFFKDA